jgi:signal transduction histidine kinase
MNLKDAPIQRKVMWVMLLTSGGVLLLTCAAFFLYEYISFRKATLAQLSTLGQIVASNSTAALAFDDAPDATATLGSLEAERHVIAACLYDRTGRIFSTYPRGQDRLAFPAQPGADGYRFRQSYIEGFQPVLQNDKRLGTLYLKSDMEAMYARFRRYGLIVCLVGGVAFVLAVLLSRQLQKVISRPVLDLAETARIVSEQSDYSVRATKTGRDELGLLTDAFNHMLTHIEVQNSKILAFNQELEQKVRARTRELELAKNELETVNIKLVKSNRDLEQFAYIASHDLQEPLRKIQVFSELAARQIDDTEAANSHLDKINASARRMTDLIVAVLHYSRLSRTGQQFTEVDLNAVLEEIKCDLELVISEKKAVIRASPLPVITGIPLQMNQLFLNLIGNSLKFNDQPPEINIRAKILSHEDINGDHELQGAERGFFEIEFQDNGIGFEQQYADQIFTIFQRLHTRQHYQGTGIGLALCKKIVENHGGTIRVQSELGKGTRFKVYLPIVA